MSRRPELDEFVERVRDLPHQAELDAAAVEVLDAFEAAGVESLLLKGPALARMLYHPGEHRGYGDIDLLVAPTDLDAGRRALAELGYANSERGGLDDVAGIMHSELWSQALESKMVQLMVDLHWRLAGCEAPADVIWKVLGRRRAWIELDGRSVPVLAHDGLALHLATHAAQHGPDDIKAIADLARGLERWDPEVWRSAADLAEQVDGAAAFAAGLRLTAPGHGARARARVAAHRRADLGDPQSRRPAARNVPRSGAGRGARRPGASRRPPPVAVPTP